MSDGDVDAIFEVANECLVRADASLVPHFDVITNEHIDGLAMHS